MSTLQNKIAEGIYNQGWDVIGRGGSWAKATAPVEKYIATKIAKAVKAEREACARICEIQSWDGPRAADDIAEAIRARGEK